MPASSVHCYTVARHGRHMPDKKDAWTPSIWEASAASWEFRGKTRFQTQRYCLVRVCLACLPYSGNADSAGWATSIACQTAAFRKTYCMVSWPLEADALDAHSCDTVTLWSVTWRLWILTQRPGKTLQLIGHNGEEPWPSTSKQEKTSWHKPPQRGGSAESFASALSNSQHTHAILATRTAIHASVFTVIVADAPV